jgi:hypothetical protein
MSFACQRNGKNTREIGGKMKYAATALPALMLIGASAHASIVIDNFDTGVTNLDLNAVGSSSQTANGNPGDIIGGDRDVELTVLSTTGLSASVNANPPAGVLAWSNASQVQSTAMLTWDDGGGLGGIDLTEGGASDAILMELIEIDLTAELTFSVTDTAGGLSSLVLSGLAPGELKFGFSSFTGSADFASVDSISLTFAGPSAVDAVVDLVATSTVNVPEPSTIATLGIGLAGMGFMRKRAQKKNA